MSFAVSTAAREDSRKDSDIIALPVADNVVIYKGCFVMIDTAGRAVPLGTTASLVFAGVAYETVDNTTTGHTAGGKDVRVWTKGVFNMVASGTATLAWNGAEMVADTGSSGNSHTVTIATTDPGIAIKVGTQAGFISATSTWVRIDGYAFVAVGSAN